MIEYYYKTIKDSSLSTTEKFKTGSWVSVTDPTEDEILQISEKFDLELDLLKDGLDQNEVPRLEIDNNVVYIFSRVPIEKGSRIITSPLLMIIGKNFVLTISHYNFPIAKRLNAFGDTFSTTQKTKLFFQIFSIFNSDYQRLINRISKDVRRSTVNLERIRNQDIASFVRFESVLNDFLAAFAPTSKILDRLLSGKIIRLYEEDKDLIEDLYLGNGQLMELCTSNLKNIVNIRDAYSTIMTNNLNRVIKFLTALTILINIPVLISSFYGMNVALPFQSSPQAFLIIVIITFTSALLLFAIFLKNRWI